MGEIYSGPGGQNFQPPPEGGNGVSEADVWGKSNPGEGRERANPSRGEGDRCV